MSKPKNMLKKIRNLFVQTRTDSNPVLCVEILESLRETVGRKTNERGASALFLLRGNVISRWALSVSSLQCHISLGTVCEFIAPLYGTGLESKPLIR